MTKLIYDEKFYNSQSEQSSRSALAVVPLLMDMIQPRSVVDVGCGVGTWLRVFRANGVADILGIDGEYVDQKMLQISEGEFLGMDLSSQISSINRDFDLALCLEVAEHVPENNANNLIGFITTLAPVVFFSAAVPGQGGAGHVNEQWPDYWRELFGNKGYQILDVIRPKIWNLVQVEPWYCQNSFLYVQASQLENYPELIKGLGSTDLPLRIIHPELFHRFVTLEYIQSKQMFINLAQRLSKRIFRKIS